MAGRCFGCGRTGHFIAQCFAKRHADDDRAPKRLKTVRDGVYVLKYPNGKLYVGKSSDIDARISEHSRRMGPRYGTPKEVSPMTPRIQGDFESWERNETLAQMRTHGIDRVRGWRYTSEKLSAKDIANVEAEICEKEDLCRYCGQKGHFQAQCWKRKAQDEGDDECSDDEVEESEYDDDDEDDDDDADDCDDEENEDDYN